MTTEVDEAAGTAALQRQIDDLRAALEAIRAGGVDAIITGAPGAEQVYSLTSADRPYRLLVEEMNEGALTISAGGIVLYANAQMLQLLGRDRGALIGRPATELVVPSDLDALAALVGLAPGGHSRHELTLSCADGHVPVVAAASCLDLEDTEVHCLVITDLRQQKAVEADLRASAERLGQFLDAVPIGVRVVDADLVSHYVNAAARDMLEQVGLGDADVDAVESSYVSSGLDEPVPRAALPLSRALLGEASHTDDLELRGPGGVHLEVELWGSSISKDTGAVEFGVVSMADVALRRRNQEIIGEQAALLDLAHDAVIAWNDQSGITSWNRGAELTYGYPRETALGRAPDDILQTTGPPRDQILAMVDEDGQWEGELHQVDAAGRSIVVASRWAIQPSADGRSHGVLEVNRDITDRKKAETALAERAAALGAANLELHRSNEDLEQFAYAASHDLAEPLRAISLPITLLSRRYSGQLDADADTYIGFIVDGCERMQQMIDSLLVYSRVGRSDAGAQRLDLNQVLADVLVMLSVTVEERAAVITSEPLPTLVAEPAQMAQVLQNLVSNALKFVSADTAPVIAISAERQGPVWRIAVDDNGIGIDARQRERVFGMFKRLHVREEYPGTGIGLALVKKIVERHHGSVGIEHAPSGSGSRFWFTLPADVPAD